MAWPRRPRGVAAPDAELLTIEETAALLGTSHKEIWKLRKQGRLRTIHRGLRWVYIWRDSVERYAATRLRVAGDVVP